MSFHEEDSLGKVYDARLVKRLLGYLRPYAGAAIAAVAMLLAVSALQAAGPFLTKIAIDRYISVGDLGGLSNIALLFIGVMTLQLGLSVVQSYVTNRIGQRIMFDMRMQLFSHLQRLHLGYFDRHPVGRTMTRITTDVDVLNELFTSGVIAIFGDLFSLTAIVVAMFYLNWKLALVALSVIPLLALATALFKIRVRVSFRKVRLCVAQINSFLQESITGMGVIQLFGQEGRKMNEFEERNRGHLDAYLESILYYSIFYPVVNLIGAVAVGLILWVGGIQVISGALTLGAVVAFIQYSDRFYKPISDLSEKFNILQSAMASSERIFKMLDTVPEVEPPAQADRSAIRGAVEFRGVDFRYNPDTPVLRNINLSIAPGEKVAIVGATGAGKSTLISLLARFYDVVSGEILVDGVDVRRRDAEDLRRSMAIVLQDPFIFSGSIEENVALWDGRVQSEAMRQAIRRVRAESFIERLPGGFSSTVTERGASLSVGQRQLLAFARALVRDPKILILDEATSSIDTQTEILIQEALAELLKGRTALVIAHRLSTIRDCDRIVVMHKGEIREQGTHRRLLEMGGLYSRLYQLQYRDQMVASQFL